MPRVLEQMTGRHFDFGIGDDVDNGVQEVRRRIAAQIRCAAALEPHWSSEVLLAYEKAAKIAEATG